MKNRENGKKLTCFDTSLLEILFVNRNTQLCPETEHQPAIILSFRMKLLWAHLLHLLLLLTGGSWVLRKHDLTNKKTTTKTNTKTKTWWNYTGLICSTSSSSQVDFFWSPSTFNLETWTLKLEPWPWTFRLELEPWTPCNVSSAFAAVNARRRQGLVKTSSERNKRFPGAANTKIRIVKHKKKKWKIKTRAKHSESGNDYQNDDQNDYHGIINTLVGHTGWSDW